jgi:adenylylsulfate kinase
MASMIHGVDHFVTFGANRSGCVIWLTGRPCSGKSTLARALCNAAAAWWDRIEVLDGDEIRAALSPDLGYTGEDRNVNVRRIGYLARLLARNGVLVVVAAISPYAATRAEIKREILSAGVRFCEIYVTAVTEVLIERDVKGLYRRALAGDIPAFTGISAPYEEPSAPDLRVDTDRMSLEECRDRILALIRAPGGSL